MEICSFEQHLKLAHVHTVDVSVEDDLRVEDFPVNIDLHVDGVMILTRDVSVRGTSDKIWVPSVNVVQYRRCTSPLSPCRVVDDLEPASLQNFFCD